MRKILSWLLLSLMVSLPAWAGDTFNILDKSYAPTTFGTSGYCWTSNGANVAPTWQACSGGGGSGTVTSVAVSCPAPFACSGGPITTSGTITYAWTGLTIGDLLYATDATHMGQLADVATGNVLLSGGVATAPSWGKVSLTSAVSGTLQAAQMPTLTANAFLTGGGATTLPNAVAITGLVKGNGASAPTAYAGTSCTNQFPRSLDANGAATCASVSGSDIASSVALAGSPTTTTQTAGDSSTKIATDAYVTTAVANAIAAVNPAVAVQASSAAKLPNSPTYTAVASGIGDFITTLTLNTALVVDGYTPVLNDRILVKNEGDSGGLGASKNGVYKVTQLHGVGLAWILTRALDFDQSSDINNTGAIPTISGTANATTQWVPSSQVTNVGTDALTFAQFSLAPSSLLKVSNNLSDLNSASTSRTNLGLGTMATQAASAVAITGGTITGGTYNGLNVTTTTGTLTITNGKTETFSNTLTFTGTDSSSVAFGGGGTVVYTTGTQTNGDAVLIDSSGRHVPAGWNATTDHNKLIGICASCYGTLQTNGTSLAQEGTANFKSGTGITVSGTDNSGAGSSDVTVAIDSTVATLTGTQTLTGKTLTTPAITSTTYANLPSASSNSGLIARVSDVGQATGGSLFISNGTTWKPLNGRVTLFTLGARASVANGSSETIAGQIQLPAGLLSQYDKLRVWLMMSKTGTTNALTGTFRMGTAGTTSDTSLETGTYMTTANKSGGLIYEFKVASATTIIKNGNGATGSSAITSSATAYPTAVTISNVSNSLWLDFSMTPGGTDSVGLEDMTVELISGN